MKQPAEPDNAALERIFHEPSRMAILSALCAAGADLTFMDLKGLTALTDGNLSRHLKALEENGVIRIRKSFVGVKPQTSVALTEKGLKRFDEYLQALSEVLHKAKQAIATDRKKSATAPMIGKKSPA
jgi:DNA-binding HxlR family transcriptional regulator